MLFISYIQQSRFLHLRRITRQHIHRITRQQHVNRLGKETQIKVHQMMRHVLEENHGLVEVAEDQIAHHFFAVVLHRGDHFLSAGVIFPRRRLRKIVCVQRLIENFAISSLRKGIHQRGGHIARAAP